MSNEKLYEIAESVLASTPSTFGRTPLIPIIDAVATVLREENKSAHERLEKVLALAKNVERTETDYWNMPPTRNPERYAERHETAKRELYAALAQQEPKKRWRIAYRDGTHGAWQGDRPSDQDLQNQNPPWMWIEWEEAQQEPKP